MSRLAIVLASLALAACGSSSSQYQAAASDPAATTNGVGLVAVRDDDGTIVRSCAVTLVDATHVVTASSCVDGVDATTLAVTFAPTTSTDDSSWIDVAGAARPSDAVVSLTLAQATNATPLPLNNDTLGGVLAGADGQLIAYGTTGANTDYRNAASGVLTAFDATTLTVRSNSASADEGGPFLLPVDGAELVVGVAGTTTDGTTFTFLRTDALTLSQ